MLSSDKININNLLNDDEFISWVTSGHKINNDYWVNVKASLKASDAKEFNRAVVVLRKLKALHIDDETSVKSQDFIKDQYSRLMADYKATSRTKAKVFRLNNWLRYAAVFVVLISVSGFIFLYNQPSNTFEVNLEASHFNTSELLLQTPNKAYYKISDTENKAWVNENGVEVTLKKQSICFAVSDSIKSSPTLDYKIFVPNGKKYSVTLVDGTNVELNSNTNISFSNSIVSKERRVELQGEAFFDVAHNENRPFVVQSSDLKIKVLGTEFNVSNYKNNAYTSTTLVDGSISVSNQQGQSKTITPGDQAKLYHNQGEILVDKVNVQEEVSWTMNRMIFENETLENIINSLNVWYDVEFEIHDNNISKYKFTGTLKKKNEITHFLQMLKYTGGINHKIEGNKVTLFFE